MSQGYQPWDEEDEVTDPAPDEVTDPDTEPGRRVPAYWRAIIAHVAHIVIASPPHLPPGPGSD